MQLMQYGNTNITAPLRVIVIIIIISIILWWAAFLQRLQLYSYNSGVSPFFSLL